MPPKRTRASSSQPAAAPLPQQRQTRSASREPEQQHEPARQTRGGKKRRRSDASSVPDPTPPTATPSKRRKGAKTTIEADHDRLEVPDMIEEEDELSLRDESRTGPGATDMDTIEVSQTTKHVHFGSDEGYDEATATHITPHPRKMTVKRRVTASPAIVSNGSTSKRFKHTYSRHSLPPSLSQSDGAPYQIVDEVEFAPLSEVLEERVKQRVQSGWGNVGIIDDDMLVLASQEEVSYPGISQDSDEKKFFEESGAETSLSQSQFSRFRSNEAVWHVERKAFHDAIESLSRESHKAKSDLQILQFEVQGLGFESQEVDALVVLNSIRDAFTRVRENLQGILPGYAEDVSNENLIDIVISTCKDFASRLRVQDQEFIEKSGLVGSLARQIEGLIDRLAEANLRKQQLEERFKARDTDAENKGRDIEDLQEELRAVEYERDMLQDDLDAKKNEAEALQEDGMRSAQDIDRLTATLQGYRDDEQRLHDLITKMEEDHKESVGKMNKEREGTVRDLEKQMDAETQRRSDVEQLLTEGQADIVRLESRIEEMEAEKDSLRNLLAEVTAQHNEEQDARETAEAGLQKKDGVIDDLEASIERLEEELNEYNSRLSDLRDLKESEQTQRQAAEADLDDRNADIEELNGKIREQGTQANELRQKLFEVQQTNERRIQDLQQAASERDEQFQSDIAQEVERREAADELTQRQAATISDLEAQIEEVEQRMHTLLAERDGRIETLEHQANGYEDQLQTLRNDLHDAEASLRTQENQNNQQREALEGNNAMLEVTVAEADSRIRDLQQEALDVTAQHESEIEDRNAVIAELNQDITESQIRVTTLEQEKSSLERRIEQEAEHMLELQSEKHDEIDALQAAIQDKQEKIRIVEEKAIQTDQSWQEVLNARDEEIATLRQTEEETTETVSVLQTDLETTKRLFREYIDASSIALVAAQNEANVHKTNMDQRQSDLSAQGAFVLQQIEDGFGMMSTTLQKTETKKTRGRKQRVVSDAYRDSGVGMAEE